jgi:hypothetical protein
MIEFVMGTRLTPPLVGNTGGNQFLFGKGKRRTARDLMRSQEDESAQNMDFFSTLHNGTCRKARKPGLDRL